MIYKLKNTSNNLIEKYIVYINYYLKLIINYNID